MVHPTDSPFFFFFSSSSSSSSSSSFHGQHRSRWFRSPPSHLIAGVNHEEGDRRVHVVNRDAVDAQAVVVGALYNLAEVNMDCRLRLTSERWAIDLLLKVIKTHSVPKVCLKAAIILESLIAKPHNRALFLAYENAFVEILLSNRKYYDTFDKIL
ncbi:Armadillo repeat-containing protein LFR [Camellia lanceoleosa]|uniref:Armadillo repeat-containing protein LFR n=1 Tax=Camellia lanceoleosa TaxID=1840588 RepID=A0ACC0HGJ7_9ERIC|nr:Armadillo repeat-containing protein LFR [Camellia lanceoleosa]